MNMNVFGVRSTGPNTVNKNLLKWKKEAINTLHAASITYMIGTLEDANLLAIHVHRYSVQVKYLITDLT